jgi:hypothetical protein
MAAVTCNIAKGREVEFYNRVFTNDPANSALIMFLLRTGGDPLSTLQDYDTLADLLAGPSNEVSVAGYARKTLTDADLDPWGPDDSTNSTSLALPLQTFTLTATGQTIDFVGLGYDNDTTGGTDANIVPITIAETRIDGTAIPTLVGDVIVDYSNLWVTAV